MPTMLSKCPPIFKDHEKARAGYKARAEFHVTTALVAVLVALLTSLYMLLMAAAGGSAGLRVAAA